MSNVTRILNRIESGDSLASSELLPIVYDELRRLASMQMAAERSDHTLQSTALVHEAYVRLVDKDASLRWDSRAHFFSAAAEAMRRILIDHARSKQSFKHGGDWRRVDFDGADTALPKSDIDLLILDDALQLLAVEHPEKAELVKLRFFAGLTVEQAARALGISSATAVRQWRHARAWLALKLAEADDSDS